KSRGTYTEALPKLADSMGRVHTTYHQVGAATGRFSSADPNLQNIPVRNDLGRKLRQAFIPQPGWQMISADYSQIELRLLAHFSKSPGLIKAFHEGVDIHTYTAALVANKSIQQVTKQERRAAKFVNFGLVYGMGARSLAKQIGCSFTEAQHWIDAYFQRYEGVREYLDSTKEFARANGYVETLHGRRVWLPDINNSNGAFRSNAERAAINAPLQGSNADIIKLAMPKVEKEMQKQNLASRILLQVHDELVLESPQNEVETITTLLPTLLKSVATLSVPLVVETGQGPNWDAAH
ncbi:MAG: DNA polymerase, partial [Lentisphaeria bacterium]